MENEYGEKVYGHRVTNGDKFAVAKTAKQAERLSIRLTEQLGTQFGVIQVTNKAEWELNLQDHAMKY